jgi:hypothetical protein
MDKEGLSRFPAHLRIREKLSINERNPIDELTTLSSRWEASED